MTPRTTRKEVLSDSRAETDDVPVGAGEKSVRRRVDGRHGGS
ncbi:hypothetical protein [Halalkalicoccus ordinarius]